MSTLSVENLQHPSSSNANITLDSNGNINLGAGSASLPSITAQGDTNTGIYFPAADNIGFATGGTIRGRWTDNGLCFGTDTAAANALDDYEEGTFTPTLLSGTTTTYTTQAGVYTRIGRVVYFRLIIRINSIGNGNNRVIAGLPFSLVAPSNNEACCSVANLDSLATNVVSVYAGIYLSGGVPLINLTSATTAASGVGTSALFQNGTQVELGGFYFTT